MSYAHVKPRSANAGNPGAHAEHRDNLNQLTDDEITELIDAVADCAKLVAIMGTAIQYERRLDDQWVRADWIASRYNVPRKFVYNHQGQLGARRVGKRTLVFSLRAVSEYMEGTDQSRPDHECL